MQRLPEHAANSLLALLLERQADSVSPAALELFRSSATCVALSGGSASHEHVVSLAGFRWGCLRSAENV